MQSLRFSFLRSSCVSWMRPTSGFLSVPSASLLNSNSHNLQWIRSKHSNTQIKRLFKKHPARKRVWERLGNEIFPLQPPPAPTYAPVVDSPEILSNGWVPPPPPDVAIPEYPFSVTRTKNKPKDAVGFLPVYSKMRKDGTLTTTRIKKVKGDQEAFIQELRAALHIPIPHNPKDDPIRVRAGGHIEIRGNYVRPVRTWLAGLGF